MLLISKVLFLLLVINYFDLSHCRRRKFRFKRTQNTPWGRSRYGTSSSAYYHENRPEIYQSHPARPDTPYVANWDPNNNELKVDRIQSEYEQGNFAQQQRNRQENSVRSSSQQQSNRQQQQQQQVRGQNLQNQQQNRQSFQQQKKYGLPSGDYPIKVIERVDTKNEVWDDSSNVRQHPVGQIPVQQRHEQDQMIEKVGQKNWNQQGRQGETHKVKTSYIEKEERVEIEEQSRGPGKNVQVVQQQNIPNQRMAPPPRQQVQQQQPQQPRPKPNAANQQRIQSQELMKQQQIESIQSHQRMVKELERQRVENEKRRQEGAEKQRLLEIQMKKEMEERELREAEEMKKRQAEAQKQREEAQRRFEQKAKAHRQYLDKLKELEEKRLERERLLVEKQREIREREMTELRARLRAEEQKRLENEARARAEEERARKEKMEMERQKFEAEKERLRKEHEAQERKFREDQARIEAEKRRFEALKKSAIEERNRKQKLQVQVRRPPPAAVAPAPAPVTIQKQQSTQIKVETHENKNEIHFLEILRNLKIQETQELSDCQKMVIAKYQARRDHILRHQQGQQGHQVQVRNGNEKFVVRPIGFVRPAAAAVYDNKSDKKSKLVMHIHKKSKKKNLKSQKLVEKVKTF